MQYRYTDNDNNIHFLTESEIRLGVHLKVELQKEQGKCNWNNWKKYMKDEGVDKNKLHPSEGLRSCIKNYQKQHNLKNPSTQPKTVRETIGELNYNKREAQDYVREFNKMKRNFTDSEILRNRLLDSINNYQFHYNIKRSKAKHKKSSKVLLASFADLHIGALVDIEMNKYNTDIAEKRVSQYANKLLNIATEQDVSDVYIANLGDMVEHVYMRFTQGFDTELDFGEQIQKSLDIVGGFVTFLFNHLSKSGIKLHYTGIAGNHDRISGNKKTNIYNDNVVTVINGFVRYLAKNVINSKMFEFIEPDTIYRTHLNLLGQNIKIVHGDLDKITKPGALGKISVYDDRNYRLVLGGHLHRYSCIEGGFNKYLVTTGSFKGPDKFSDQLSVGASLSQAAILIDESGSIETTNVELD